MSPTVVHVAPHPDDEALGCPGALLHLLDRGWTVVSVLASLGFPEQWERRRAEFEEASRRARLRAGVPRPSARHLLDPMTWPRATERVALELPRIRRRARRQPSSCHPLRTTCTTGTRRWPVACERALERCRRPSAGGCGGFGATSRHPTSSIPFGEPDLARMLHILEAYAGELERNDYRRLLSGRAATNAVLGSERVFGFGSPAASPLPYAEVLTEVRRVGRPLDGLRSAPARRGPAARRAFGIDLTAWVESPSAARLSAPSARCPNAEAGG